jgi:GAF domain-containing protein
LPQGPPYRKWQVIAQELSTEKNPERVVELSKELNHALDEQELRKWQRRSLVAEPEPAKPELRHDYERIVDQAVALMHSDYASVQMLYPERGSGGELQLLAFRGFNPQAAQFWEWVRADSKSTCGIALRDKERVIAPDIAGCEFMAGSDDQQTYLQTGIHACQTTPLIGSAGKVIGMISTHWRTPHQPSEKDLQLFDSLAREAAKVIESCREAREGKRRR